MRDGTLEGKDRRAPGDRDQGSGHARGVPGEGILQPRGDLVAQRELRSHGLRDGTVGVALGMAGTVVVVLAFAAIMRHVTR